MRPTDTGGLRIIGVQMMSKGSARRPSQVSYGQESASWMNIFEPGDKWEARLTNGAVLCTKHTYEEARDCALDYLPEGVNATIVKV